MWSSGRGAVRVARVALLVAGVAVSAVSFIGLVAVQLDVRDAAPWWYLGVAGIVAVLVAIGSPWSPGRPGD
jgi:hypothetical protein